MDNFLLQDIYAQSPPQRSSPTSTITPEWIHQTNEWIHQVNQIGFLLVERRLKVFGLSLPVATEESGGLGLCSSPSVEFLFRKGHPFTDWFKSEDGFTLSSKNTYKSKNTRHSSEGINRSYMPVLQCRTLRRDKKTFHHVGPKSPQWLSPLL